ncbi:trp operon repressor [Endozoicomonas arenosclerae]|uniref:trp operon repressor n=1 Tax=Endozoicomonas arenosclerae TaxID=1633495 RepID=UPI0007808707|nr:trp operon repressor [Endozoicomonas arenosclerae]
MSAKSWSEVLDLIQSQPDRKALDRVMEVLLTPEEQEAVASRLAIMRALLNGEASQREIAARFGVSIAKVTRCSNYLKRLDQQEKQILEADI